MMRRIILGLSILLSLAINAKEYQMSEQGKNFIRSYETLKLTPYKNPGVKYAAIGYGHSLRNGEWYKSITKAEAECLFEEDMKWVNAAINRLLGKLDAKFSFSQSFIDGLGSLIYNCGEYGVSTTEFYKRMKRCRYDKLTGNINKSDLHFSIAAIKTDKVFLNGHKKRRYEEHKMMLN